MSLVPGIVLSAGSSSTGYTITHSVFDNGGGAAASASYRLHSSQAQAAPTGVAASTGYALFEGYLSIPDTDADGSLDDTDNCQSTANPGQLDTDMDGFGNACDLDDDNDGLDDDTEATLGTNPLIADTDGDGLSDFDEVNVDGNPFDLQPGVDTDPNDPDSDNDGLIDSVDPDPWTVYVGDGDLAPYGAPDGQINIADLLIAKRIALGLITPSALDRSHGDVYPSGAPDGVIDLSDVILIRQLVLTQP